MKAVTLGVTKAEKSNVIHSNQQVTKTLLQRKSWNDLWSISWSVGPDSPLAKSLESGRKRHISEKLKAKHHLLLSLVHKGQVRFE